MCISHKTKVPSATMAALWNSAGLSQPTAHSWLPDVSQPRGSLSSSPTAEPFWSVLWWGLTTCKPTPDLREGLIFPGGPLWEGEGKEQSLLGTEMGWVRFVLKVQPLLLIQRLIFNLGIQSSPWRKTRTDLADSFKRSTMSCRHGREHSWVLLLWLSPRWSCVLLSRQEAVGWLRTPPHPPPPSSLSSWMLSCLPFLLSFSFFLLFPCTLQI